MARVLSALAGATDRHISDALEAVATRGSGRALWTLVPLLGGVLDRRFGGTVSEVE